MTYIKKCFASFELLLYLINFNGIHTYCQKYACILKYLLYFQFYFINKDLIDHCYVLKQMHTYCHSVISWLCFSMMMMLMMMLLIVIIIAKYWTLSANRVSLDCRNIRNSKHVLIIVLLLIATDLERPNCFKNHQ